ncbi:galanin receptor type 1-like [Ptychodera flava]|uniref:galanin receptor type 1-like n=1 Tax=Ptychodera flava TaxID=63121 RepID=UPI003969EFF7
MDEVNVSTNTTSSEDPGDGVKAVLFNVGIGVVGCLGVAGNALVCLVFFRVKSLRTVTNMFILNQSLIDLTSSFVFVLSYLGTSVDTLPAGLRGTVLCKFWLSLYPLWSLFDSSSLNLCAITIERYFAIVHPVLHHNKFDITKVRIVIPIIWFAGFVNEWFWPYVHYIEGDTCSNQWPSDHLRRFVGVLVFVVEYAFPMTVFVFCYLKIFLVLRKRANDHKTNSLSSNQGDGMLNKASKNVTKTLCVVVVTYFLCWTVPSLAYFQNWVFGGPLDWNGDFYKFTVISVFCNVCCNPIIYALMWDHFRRALKETFYCNGSRNQVSPEQSNEAVTRT